MAINWDALDAKSKEVGVEVMDFKPLPTGTYEARFLECVLDQNGGVIERRFEVISGEHQGKKQKDWLNLTSKDGGENEVGVSRINKEMHALDENLLNMPLLLGLTHYCDGVVGETVEIYVSTKPRKDKPSEFNSSIYVNSFLTNGAALPF